MERLGTPRRATPQVRSADGRQAMPMPGGGCSLTSVRTGRALVRTAPGCDPSRPPRPVHDTPICGMGGSRCSPSPRRRRQRLPGSEKPSEAHRNGCGTELSGSPARPRDPRFLRHVVTRASRHEGAYADRSGHLFEEGSFETRRDSPRAAQEGQQTATRQAEDDLQAQRPSARKQLPRNKFQWRARQDSNLRPPV